MLSHQKSMEEQIPSKMSLMLLILNGITTSTIISYVQPFLPEMIIMFGYEEYQKGYFSGLIQTGFYIGRIFGCVVVGRIADKISKYYILKILFGLCAVFTFLFGFTFNIYFVIVIRLCVGVVSGMAVINKALVHDLCDERHQFIGMLCHIIGVSVGGVIAPFFGGYLQNPDKLYPSIFGEVVFFQKYPYFLCSVVVICLIIINVALIFPAEHSYTKKVSLHRHMVSVELEDRVQDIKLETTMQAFFRIVKSKGTLISLGIYMIYSLCNIGVNELVVVYLSTDVLAGGLGQTTKQIGDLLIYSSLASIIFQVFVFTYIIKRIGVIQVAKYGNIVSLPLTLLIPVSYITITQRPWFETQILLYFILIGIRALTFIIFGAISLMLNNSVKPDDIGTVNGIGLSLSCAFRALAPITFDSIYSATIGYETPIGMIFGSVVSFTSIGFVVLIVIIMCFYLPASLGSRKK